MASRRVSISALLCEDDPPVRTLSPARQRHPPRRTPSPDLHTWPPPPPSRQGVLPLEPEPPYMPPSPSPRPSYSQSPYSTTRISSHSPISTRPPSVHSPSTPLLYTQRHALSPGPYNHNQSPPSSGASHYDPSFQPAVSPTLRHHRYVSHTEPIASSSTHHTSLSRISTASSSSFPQALLNPVSPQQSPLGGLEALVQAATVERDRLEAKASLDRRADATRSTTVRRSPELFRSSHESPRNHLQAPEPRTPITPSLISGPPSRDPYSESSLRVGPAPETHPSKRQRHSDPHSGSDLSWDSPPSWDSSPQFTGLMGPGIKPRRRSSEVRTEIRPTLPIPSWDKEEVSLATSRVSPTRERPAKRQYLTEEKSSRSHVPSYREPVTSTSFALDDSQHVFVAEESRLTLHQDSWSNVDSHPLPPKVSRSDLLLEKQVPPPSPPHPRPFFRLSEPLVPLAPAPRQQSPPPERGDRRSLQAHPPPRNSTPAPAATAAQKSVEMEVATGSEQSMDSTVPNLPMQEPSVALAECLPLDSLTIAVQDSPVFITSSSSLNVHDDCLGPAVSVKSPSPASPPPEAHDTDITPAVQVVQSPLGISRPSSLPREDVPNPPGLEQEPCPPPTTASPSPQALSPSPSGLQDPISADQPVGHRMTSVFETGPVSQVTELQKPLDTQTSLTPSGESEVVNSPVASLPPVMEAVPVPLPKPDGSPRANEVPIPIEIEIKIEASPELEVAIDANQTQGTEQSRMDMDVDEELLSLIADDLPSRSLQSMPRKREFFSSEIEHIPSDHAPLKQESALGTLPPSHPSPGTSSFNINLEAVSTLSPFTRDSEASTLKPEERPPQKKKVNQLVLGFLLVLLTPTRQNSRHSPKVAVGQVVRQRRS
jgi:hypothetical protein